MKVTVCIGSSCHLKGSRQVVDKFNALIESNALGEKVNLSGTFCMNNCQEGVCVMVDDQVFSVTEQSAEEFFNQNILSKVQ